MLSKLWELGEEGSDLDCNAIVKFEDMHALRGKESSLENCTERPCFPTAPSVSPC